LEDLAVSDRFKNLSLQKKIAYFKVILFGFLNFGHLNLFRNSILEFGILDAYLSVSDKSEDLSRISPEKRDQKLDQNASVTI
jgi:hypothetical protein